MKRSLPYPRQAADSADRATFAPETRAADARPLPGEVLGEVGLILAVHLAVALAVCLTLQAFGIT